MLAGSCRVPASGAVSESEISGDWAPAASGPITTAAELPLTVSVTLLTGPPASPRRASLNFKLKALILSFPGSPGAIG